MLLLALVAFLAVLRPSGDSAAWPLAAASDPCSVEAPADDVPQSATPLEILGDIAIDRGALGSAVQAPAVYGRVSEVGTRLQPRLRSAGDTPPPRAS